MTFFCRADDIFEKSVEQSRFEQMHFEQLTLTRANRLQFKIKINTSIFIHFFHLMTNFGNVDVMFEYVFVKCMKVFLLVIHE
jgi:hypothetical protein